MRLTGPRVPGSQKNPGGRNNTICKVALARTTGPARSTSPRLHGSLRGLYGVSMGSLRVSKGPSRWSQGPGSQGVIRGSERGPRIPGKLSAYTLGARPRCGGEQTQQGAHGKGPWPHPQHSTLLRVEMWWGQLGNSWENRPTRVPTARRLLRFHHSSRSACGLLATPGGASKDTCGRGGWAGG